MSRPVTRAGALLRDLRAEALPPWLPGEPRNLAALRAADRAARALLDLLARRNGIDAWTWPTFRALFLEGLLAAAKPGARIEDRGGEFLMVAPRCPLLDEARLDPRACGFCRLLPEAALRIALPDEPVEVRYDGLLTSGDPACVLRIAHRPPPATACGEVPA
jgi:hypothetical protein